MSVAWELIPLFGPLSRRGLNPIKPVYDPDWPDWSADASAKLFQTQQSAAEVYCQSQFCSSKLSVYRILLRPSALTLLVWAQERHLVCKTACVSDLGMFCLKAFWDSA